METKMMKRAWVRTILGIFITVLVFTGCKKKNGIVDPELSVSPSAISFLAEGGMADVTINTNAKWTISNSASSWLLLSGTSGNSGSSTVQLTAGINGTGVTRSAILNVNSANGQARRVTVSQPPTIYPSYNISPQPANNTGMGSNATQLVSKFKLGWNIGNTMEAPGGETGWGNPQITESFVQFVKQKGFTAIRIPCAWNLTHLSDPEKAKIDPVWLNRVKQVVGYCVNNDMYVMLNIHWDGGWLENNCTQEKMDSVNAKQKAFWEQIATSFRDFDEHLMFASANEPNADNAAKMQVLLSYHQTFINAIRSTGGRNTYRCLIIQGSSELVSPEMFPSDPTPNRIIYEDHNYTPSLFTIMDADQTWGNLIYYWGAGNHSTIEPARNATWGEEPEIDQYFNRIKTKFVDKGIPVVLGEFGAYRRTTPLDMVKHQASVDYWLTYVTRKALQSGVKPFFWDTGGALNRSNNTVLDQRTIDAIIAGGQ
jgi:endoglucanase